MKKTIYKYPLLVIDYQELSMPIGAEILTIQMQDCNIYLWALVDINEPNKEMRSIELFGTGHPINCDMGISRNYISTFQLGDGKLVFHAFEYNGI